MKFRFKYILIYCPLLLSLFSCKKFVEIGPPKNQLVLDNVYQSNETANSAIIAIYAQMFDNLSNNPYSIGAFTGLAADELTNFDSGLSDIYSNSIDPSTFNKSNDFWMRAYKLIYYSNSVFEGCEKSGKLSEKLKAQLQGESLFIRAYWYFYLVNLYGDVPLVLTTDYSANSKLKRSSTGDIYNQIIADLKKAQTLLPEDYAASDGIARSTQRVRPNKSSVTALLARVYLYTGNSAEAETQSNSIITNVAAYTLMPLKEVFLQENNTEAIWQLMPANNASINTYEGLNFIPTSSPVMEGKPVVSDRLYQAFETGDLRKVNWIGSIDDNGTTYYYPHKYKVQSGGDNPTEYSVLFRLAEQYLIRAEARANQNNLAGAIEDIDMIRVRAGLPALKDINPSISKSALITAILKERQVELFTEQGHRWFDLKRSKTIDQTMQVVSPLKNGEAWNSTKQLWPVPQTEIFNNPNMKQSPGYN